MRKTSLSVKEIDRKYTIYCVLFAAMLSVILGAVSYLGYSSMLLSREKARLLSLARTAADCMDGNCISAQPDWSDTSEAAAMQRILNSVWGNNELQGMYLLRPTGEGVELLLSGKPGSMPASAKSFRELSAHERRVFEEAMNEPGYIGVYTSEQSFDICLASLAAVQNGKGQNTAMVCAVIGLNKFNSSVVCQTAVTIVCITVLIYFLTMLFMALVRQQIMRPLESHARDTGIGMDIYSRHYE